jgi:hypothetical protein
MQNLYQLFISLRTLLSLIFINTALVFGFVSLAHAEQLAQPLTQEQLNTVLAEKKKSLDASTTEAVLIATVNVQDIQLLKQEDNKITLGFNVSNKDGIQPEIIYAVNLLKKEADKTYTVVDQEVYDEDVVTLGTNDKLHKEVVYTVPSYLKGDYYFGIEARNHDGLIFGMVQTYTPITFAGTGTYVSIDPATCNLTVQGEKGGKTYTLTEGVDIAQTETLLAHCTLTSTFDVPIIVTPTITTHYRSPFGKVVGTETKDTLTLEPHKKTAFTTTLPKITDPQAYDAILTFATIEKEVISAPTTFHYVLHGESATIQNLTLDKDYYVKGDTAQISFFWTPSADSFPDSRLGRTEASSYTAIFTITNTKNQNCAESYTQSLSDIKFGGLQKFSIPVTENCAHPTIVAQIADANGKVLAANTYAITSKNAPAEEVVSTSTETQLIPNKLQLAMVSVVALLCIGVFVFLYIRKNKAVGTTLALMFVIGTGLLGGVGDARAYTMSAGLYAVTVTMDKSTYTPGETMTITGSYFKTGCWNSIGITTGFVSLTAEESWAWWMFPQVTKNIKNTSATFTAPASDGWYFSELKARTVDWFNSIPYYTGYTGMITFNVVTPPPPPTLSFWGAPTTITQGNSTALSWSAPGASWCSASGGAFAGGKAAGGSQTITPPLGTNTYTMECGNVSGSSGVKTVTINVTPPPPVNGVCGATLDSCSSGTPDPNTPADSASMYNWTCSGSGGGGSPTCSLPKPPYLISSNALPCTIASGASTCPTNVSWTIGNPVSPSIRQNGAQFSTAVTSAGTPITLKYGTPVDNLVTFYDGASSLGSITPAGTCEDGTTWNTTSNTCAPPATPTGLTATPNTSCGTGIINISWNSSFGATSYTLKDSGTTIYTGPATSFTHSGLADSSLHKYTIIANNPPLSSAPSDPPVTATAPPTCPNLTAVNLTPTSGYVQKAGSSIAFTGRADNSLTASIAEGGWAGLEIDANGDGVVDNYYAVPNSTTQLGAFTPGQTKPLSYTLNNPTVGSYRYRFNVDSTNLLKESDDTDNRSAWSSYKVISGTLSATPLEIDGGSTVTLSWNTSSNVTSCTVYSMQAFNTDSWTGTSNAGISSTPLYEDTTYILECDGINNLAAVTIKVNIIPELTASARIVDYGGNVTLTWNTHNGNEALCALTGGQLTTTNPIPAAGDVNTGSVSTMVQAATTYTLSCPNPLGGPNLTDTVRVEVRSQGFET